MGPQGTSLYVGHSGTAKAAARCLRSRIGNVSPPFGLQGFGNWCSLLCNIMSVTEQAARLAQLITGLSKLRATFPPSRLKK